MIGAGFRLGSQSPESKIANHSARVGQLAGGRLAPVRRNWGLNRARAREKALKDFERKLRSAPRYLERLPVLAAFWCFETLAGACRSGPPQPPSCRQAPSGASVV